MNSIDPLLRRSQRDEVGLEEVAVVVGVFLAAHGVRAAIAFVPMSGLLTDEVPALDEVDLPTGFVLDGATDAAHAVDVLDLAARAQRCARLAHADVRIDAHAALFHLGIAGADGQQNGAQFADVGASVVGAANVGTADDFDQRHSGTVEVDQRGGGAVDATTRAADMRALAGVFLHVCALDADSHPVGKFEVPVDVEWLVVLADLICLGHVGVEVVLAVKGAGLDGAVEGGADAHRQLNSLFVEHRQRPGKAQGDGVDVGVGLVAEPVGAGAEQLGVGGQFHMDLQAHDQFPVAGQTVVLTHFATALSSAAPTRNITGSCRVPASTCTPTGMPCAPVPKGTLMPGWPARLVGIV